MKKWMNLLNKAKNDAGLTLVELLAVVVIIGIIAGIAIPITSNAVSNAKNKTTMAEVAELQSALERYAQDNGGYPTDSAVLLTSLSKYVHGNSTDGWDNTMKYWSTGDEYVIWAPTKSDAGVEATDKTAPKEMASYDNPYNWGTLPNIGNATN